MTGSELAALIGRQGLLLVNGLRIPVQVTDAKRAYGNLRYQITPLYKDRINVQLLGREWVAAERVQLTEG